MLPSENSKTLKLYNLFEEGSRLIHNGFRCFAGLRETKPILIDAQLKYRYTTYLYTYILMP